MDDEMIERVAKAIEPYVIGMNEARDATKLAIKALREPTDKMLKAEGVYTGCHTCGGHKEGWKILIDCITND